MHAHHFTNGKNIVNTIQNGMLLSHKGKEMLSLATTWIELMIILCEITQAPKHKYYMISTACGNEKC
jgi:hypothetical protein